MAETLAPADAAQVRDAIAWAVAEEAALELFAGDTKRGLGRAVEWRHRLDLSALAGVTLYEPEELVLGAGPATPISEIEALLAAHNQHLAFEPPDLGPLFGRPAGAATLGGIVACNLSGPRRIKAGAVRDHFLGVACVTGRGEAIKAGGRVVKNVTGYDLCKLLAGSHGTLAAMTGVTLKVMPAPEKLRTVLLYGHDAPAAVAAMATALGGPYEVSAAAHLPAPAAARSAVRYVARAGAAVTALRLEGPGPSVTARCDALRRKLGGETEELHGTNSRLLWRQVGDVAPLLEVEDRALWRLSVAPAQGAAVAAAITRRLDCRLLYDWAGGLIWVAHEGGDAAAVRAAVDDAGGHALLVRGGAALRAAVAVFHPQPPVLAALTARIKDAFDPRRILNPGRMYPGV